MSCLETKALHSIFTQCYGGTLRHYLQSQDPERDPDRSSHYMYMYVTRTEFLGDYINYTSVNHLHMDKLVELFNRTHKCKLVLVLL